MLNRLLLLSFTLFMALTLPCDASHPADEENPCAGSACRRTGRYFHSDRFEKFDFSLDLPDHKICGRHVTVQLPEVPTLRALHVLWKWEMYWSMGLISPLEMVNELYEPGREKTKERMEVLVSAEHVRAMRARLLGRCTDPCWDNLPGRIIENVYQCMHPNHYKEERFEKAHDCLKEAHSLLVTSLFPEEVVTTRVDASSDGES